MILLANDDCPVYAEHWKNNTKLPIGKAKKELRNFTLISQDFLKNKKTCHPDLRITLKQVSYKILTSCRLDSFVYLKIQCYAVMNDSNFHILSVSDKLSCISLFLKVGEFFIGFK